MKRPIRLMILFLAVCAVSCAYPVTKEINESAKLGGKGKVGTVIRVSQKGRVSRDEIVTSISRTLPAYRHNRPVELLVDIPSGITEFMDDADAFYQSENDNFRKFKSIGVAKSFIRTHESDLKDEMSKSGLDLLVIYEVYTVVSVEMQMMKFSTVMAVLDKNLELVYLDHQTDTSETLNTDITSMKAEIVNHITDRFIEKMDDLEWIEEL